MVLTTGTGISREEKAFLFLRVVKSQVILNLILFTLYRPSYKMTFHRCARFDKNKVNLCTALFVNPRLPGHLTEANLGQYIGDRKRKDQERKRRAEIQRERDLVGLGKQNKEFFGPI